MAAGVATERNLRGQSMSRTQGNPVLEQITSHLTARLSAADSLLSRAVSSVTSCRTAWSTGAAGLTLLLITLLLLSVGGCADQTSLLPNSDPSLRKTKTEFARDAVQRHPYHADAPHAGKIQGAASVDYGSDTLQIANLTNEDWNNVEVWVNEQWVVFVPRVPGKAEVARTLDFTMFYDRLGRPFPEDNSSPESVVHKVEIYRDGRLYELAGLMMD